MSLEVGETQTFSTTVHQPEVETFLDLTHDPNPIHRDAEAADETRFGEIITPGMFGAALIPGTLTRLTDETVVYLSQDLEFMAPVTPGDVLTVESTVVEAVGKNIFRIRTVATVFEDGEETSVIEGEAHILLDE